MSQEICLINKKKVFYPINNSSPDDLFISCGSFEERFLGVPSKIKGKFPKKFILFRFKEPKYRINELIREAEGYLSIEKYTDRYYTIIVEHGKSLDSILELHEYIKKNELNDFTITIDISTFTKDLLINLIFYLINFSKVQKLRFLYSIPNRYASPQEGWLSTGIKKIHYPPMCWNEWSPLKDNLLIIILGFEEIRAWSLIDNFSADLNWLFITKPGSKNQWDNYCEEYNKRLLKKIAPIDKIPAIDPFKTSEILKKHLTKNISEKYNIFICPLGTKPQLIGVIKFILSNPKIPANIITTTVSNYNIPYYSWGTGDTFEFYFSE